MGVEIWCSMFPEDEVYHLWRYICTIKYYIVFNLLYLYAGQYSLLARCLHPQVVSDALIPPHVISPLVLCGMMSYLCLF